MHRPLRLTLAVGLIAVLAGCNLSGPSYSVDDTGNNVKVTIKKTDVGDINVEIPKPRDESRTRVPGGIVEKTNYTSSGGGTSSGSRSSGGKKVDYEITYKSEGTTVTITSVKVNGKEVGKSAW